MAFYYVYIFLGVGTSGRPLFGRLLFGRLLCGRVSLRRIVLRCIGRDRLRLSRLHALFQRLFPLSKFIIFSTKTAQKRHKNSTKRHKNGIKTAQNCTKPHPPQRYVVRLRAVFQHAAPEQDMCGPLGLVQANATECIIPEPLGVDLQDSSFEMQNSSFLIHNSSFLIQNSSFVIQNS